MSDNLLRDVKFNGKLRWLMFLRVVIVTFLLGIAAFIQVKGTETLSGISFGPVYFIILLTYILSFLYLFLLKIIKSLGWNIYIQSLSDVALITALVYVTGGVESTYSFLYALVIIYSALFLGGRGSIIIAAAAGILYGLLIEFEYYGLIQPVYFASRDYGHSAGYVLSRGFVHIVSFYIVALLAGFAAGQEKKTRELLAEKESAFDQLDLLHRSIIESVDTGILTVDLQGYIKSFNRAAEEITGLSHSEVINRKIGDFSQGFYDMLNRVKDKEGQGSDRSRLEVTVSDKILGCSASPLMDGGEKKIGNILIFQNLTDIKEMERQAEKNKRLALIGEMAAGLAHEMRNPLASIGGPIQMLSRDLNLSGTDKKLMRIILRGKNQLESFMRDFLLLARPSPVSYENVDIEAVMDDVIESVRYVPDWHEGIEIIRNSCDQAGAYGSRAEIRQIIWNLIVNAVQSMPDGGRVKIETWPAGVEYLEIQISDTGCGIEKENSIRVLEPFFTTREKGTGLGLAIVSRIIESHRGTFRIESEEGKGTSCRVLLPRGK